MRARPGAALAAAIFAAGCASSPEPQAAGEMCAEGILTSWSTEVERRVTVEPDDGAPVTLDDAGVPELSRLTGARVRVCGTTMEDGTLGVARYDLRSVDGAPAYLGTLVRSGDSFFLATESGERMGLAGVPAGLAAAEGRRVWVSVREGGEGLRVVAWGSLQEAG